MAAKKKASKRAKANGNEVAASGTEVVIPKLVARVSQADAEEAASLGQSAQMAVAAVDQKLAELHTLVTDTKREIERRKKTAIAFKAITLLGGLGVLTGKVAGLDQVIGALIVIVAGADLLMGNYQRLQGRVAALDAAEELIDAVEDATSTSITVMRLAGQKPPHGGPMAALRAYADFMGNLQGTLSKGHREVRSAHRKLEIELMKNLDLSKPSGGDGGVAPQPKRGLPAGPGPSEQTGAHPQGLPEDHAPKQIAEASAASKPKPLSPDGVATDEIEAPPRDE